MADWFYSTDDGQQAGPVPEGELRRLAAAGALRADHSVWKEGMADWLPAARIRGLIPAAVPAVAGGSSLPPALLAAPARAYPTPRGAEALAAPRAALLPIWQTDAGPFFKLGNGQVAGFGGPAYASPQAIYVLKQTEIRNNSMALGGGLVGGLLAEAFRKPSFDVRSCSVTDLAGPIRTLFDPKGKRDKLDVVVLSKGAISKVDVAGFNTVMTVHTAAEKIKISFGLFSRGKLREFLTQNGWTLGAYVEPTEAASHGVGFGRSPDQPPPRQQSRALRILYAILAVALFIGVVALKIYLG